MNRLIEPVCGPFGPPYPPEAVTRARPVGAARPAGPLPGTRAEARAPPAGGRAATRAEAVARAGLAGTDADRVDALTLARADARPFAGHPPLSSAGGAAPP
ncbi:hypothetical protein GCM10010123_16910 [Pilimelia anulata]|uniref:Uncharacterized protein n=1 Tax=Pilimelia anulata TaxID=53371 RepID=A0A8J3B2P5_9ACTN|nr:hypothetical protein GCM10010123_16910 [Pilimelia anulata]